MDGKFDPEDEISWEKQEEYFADNDGKYFHAAMCRRSGNCSACSDKVLKEFGVTGIEVQMEKREKITTFTIRVNTE